jgi:AcrR family transcriptional regulator
MEAASDMSRSKRSVSCFNLEAGTNSPRNARSTEMKRPEQGGRSLRADAEVNRSKLLEAAHEVFFERGVDASLEEIAKRSSVGIGTLYRHFPSRAILLAAASDEQLAIVARKAAELNRLDSRLDALHLFLAELIKRTSMYHGLAASLHTVLNSSAPGCKAATLLGKRLLKRAQDTHEARSDIKFEDLVSLVGSVSLSSQKSGAQEAARVARLLEVIVGGLRPIQR